MRFCANGHLLTLDNVFHVAAYSGGQTVQRERCKICHNEQLRRSRFKTKFEREAKRNKSSGSGQIGRKYQPEFKLLDRDPFDLMKRCEEMRR